MAMPLWLAIKDMAKIPRNMWTPKSLKILTILIYLIFDGAIFIVQEIPRNLYSTGLVDMKDQDRPRIDGFWRLAG